MKKMIELAHDFLREYTKGDAICADFTMGNGYDTLRLCQLAQQGHVYAFDIQQAAIQKTRQRLKHANCDNVTLILDSHANFQSYIKEALDIGIFNFGYLPQDQSMITTTLEHTKKAIPCVFQQLKHHGHLILVVYPGHEEGKKEAEFIQQWCESLQVQEASVLCVQMVQKPTAPKLYFIEKLRC